ncbi:MAG: hypothetical protein RIK87_02190 [Fuerstiella sp.]
MIADDQIDGLPLTERLKKAQYLSRELSEHLRQAYLPKLADLRLVTKEFDPAAVTDQRVFDCTVAVLEAEEFTDSLYEKLHQYLESIRREMKDLLFTDASSESSQALRMPILDFDIDELSS